MIAGPVTLTSNIDKHSLCVNSGVHIPPPLSANWVTLDKRAGFGEEWVTDKRANLSVLTFVVIVL